jgi:hypothetical protein
MLFLHGCGVAADDVEAWRPPRTSNEWPPECQESGHVSRWLGRGYLSLVNARPSALEHWPAVRGSQHLTADELTQIYPGIYRRKRSTLRVASQV